MYLGDNSQVRTYEDCQSWISCLNHVCICLQVTQMRFCYNENDSGYCCLEIVL
jgi:hypothetical protein